MYNENLEQITLYLVWKLLAAKLYLFFAVLSVLKINPELQQISKKFEYFKVYNVPLFLFLFRSLARPDFEQQSIQQTESRFAGLLANK